MTRQTATRKHCPQWYVCYEIVFAKLLEGLAKSMTDMCSKLPERFGKLKARAELAQRTVEALKA